MEMGLKYTMFLWRGSSESLKRKLLEMDVIIDRTEEMIKEREWFNNSSIRDLREKGTPTDIEKIERRERPEYYFSVWGMDLPDTGFVVGGYSNRRLFPGYYLTLFWLLMGKAKTEEFVLSEYHHGSNWGRCVMIQSRPPHNVRIVSPTPEEEEKYELFSIRADDVTGYPITVCHEFLNKQRPILPWTFSVECCIQGIIYQKEGDGI